jgi:hypothetical protein
LQRRSPTFDEPMEPILEKRLLDLSDLEKKNPQERQESWEREQLNDFQRIPV